MDRMTARNILKANLPNYLMQKGINIDRKFICLCPEHVDHTPSMQYDKRRNICHCFSCGANADIFQLIEWEYNTTSFNETFELACDLFGLDIDKPNTSKKEQPKLKIKPVTQIAQQKQEDIKKAEPEVCHRVYQTLKDLSPLTESDKNYLIEVRGLSAERIQKDYFSFITEPQKRAKVINNIKKLTGYSDDIIKYVPGFCVKNKTGQLDYYNCSGIGMLLHDANGMINAIQIRRDTAEKGRRYCWFTSSFAIDNEKYDGGSTMGAVKDVLIPKNPKKCLCITEGRFKSEILAENRNMVISIQGVSTWKGIDSIINQIREEHEVQSIYLMFDSDVMGNYQLIKLLRQMSESLNKLFPELKIMTGTWSIKYGKGIDDCILNGNMDKVKFFDALNFYNTCQNTFLNILKQQNIKSIKKMSNDIRKKMLELSQQENENLFGI